MFAGEPTGGLPAHRIVRRGGAMVPEGRRLFPVLRERRASLPAALSGGWQQMVGKRATDAS